MSKSGKSVKIVAFHDTPGKDDMITIGKKRHKYINQVKESHNIGTRGWNNLDKKY